MKDTRDRKAYYRNARLVNEVLAGKTPHQLHMKYGISRPRVFQILTEFGLVQKWVRARPAPPPPGKN